MQLYISKNLVLQLRAPRLPIAGCTARNWQPWSPQLQNEVFADIQLHLQRSFTT